MKYENVSLVDIKSWSVIDSKEELFDSIIVIENYPLDKQLTEKNNILKVESYSMFESTNFDLTLAVEMNNQYTMQFSYNTLKFDEQLISRLSEHFCNILNFVIEKPDEKLSEIEMLSKEEKDKVLYKFNNTYAEYPRDKTLHELFEEQVEKTPDHIALIYQNQKLTYRELNEKANQLARTLQGKEIKPEELVGIMVERSLKMIIGIIGILKSGAAYLPIDPKYPSDRIRYILTDSNVKVLLTQNELTDNAEFEGIMIALDNNELYSGDSSNLPKINKPDDLAYVIYTSGTTGKPKGVMIEHKSITNAIIWRKEEYQFGPKDISFQLFSFTFDGFLTSFFTTIVSGARVIILAEDEVKDPIALRTYIRTMYVTNFISVPSLYLAILEVLTEEDAKSLRIITLAGEKVNSDLVKRSKKLNLNLEIVNEYGPTENSVISTIKRNLDSESIITIGKPIANTQIYVVDKNLRLLPIGVSGEMCLGGQGLARGYLNNPELTAEKFVLNPFQHNIPGEIMYRTGDLARWLHDGNIEFLGRIDHQVKIRGFRIELGEIENCLMNYENIKEVVVIDRKDENGNKYLCAYIVARREINGIELTSKKLREYLSKNLPDYMIPSYFVQLKKIPLNKNGKLDRKALSEPEGNIRTGVAYEAPRNEVEEKLASIWMEVLAVEKVGINDDFFDLGGHSLKVTILVSKIHKEFDVGIPLDEVFKRPTIKEFAAYIQNSEQNLFSSIQLVPEREYYETSSAQKRMYMLQQFDLNSTSYNIPAVFVIKGNLDLERLENAFKGLIERHETLRTSFETLNDKIIQRINKEVEFRVEYIEKADRGIEEIVNEFVRAFDLTKTPLFRVGVTRLKLDEHILMFDMHHIISDGTSMGILVDEFANLYESKDLDVLRIQYKDYAEWQNELLKAESMKKQEEYWINRFSDDARYNAIPVLNMPTDYARPIKQNYEGDSIRFVLNKELTKELKRIAKKTNSTLYMVLLSVVNILLSKYSGQEDIIVGSPIAGRPHADLEKIIGMFVNTLAMRNNPEGIKSYEEFINEVKENVLKAYENQDYQFEELVDKLNLRRNINRNPLFDVMFVLQNMQLQNFDNGEFRVENLELRRYDYHNKISKFDLTFYASEVASIDADNVIILNLEYSVRLFKRETVERMISYFQNILKEVVANSKIKLSEIKMLSDEKRDKILYEFNNTYSDYPRDKTIHQLFEEQVEKTPGNIVVLSRTRAEEKKLTYRELNAKANSLANILRKQGVQEETLVGIVAEKSLEMIIGILAILKAGGAYLPIDPEYPEDRIKLMLEDCSIPLLLVQGDFRKNIDLNCNRLDILDAPLYSSNCYNLENKNTSTSLAYVIYTSGSTGKPKGVMVEHGNVVRLIKNTNYIEFEQGNKILQTGTLAFDAYTFEIWGALLNGLELHLGRHDLILSTEKMKNYIVNNKISMLWLTAPLFNVMAEERADMFKTLKYLLVGGDVLSPKHINKVKRECSNLKIINGYGPTENTTFSTTFLIDPAFPEFYNNEYPKTL
ncbi:MAG: amino acid adenylation domain-containing protein [Halanaerobiales bacterium]|nr:amino acid adenylation domain-containing protein [Halanaerobiales bacterium]